MPQTVTYQVPGMSCGHCEAAVKQALGRAAGVDAVKVDLSSKLVTVSGRQLTDEQLRAAIEEAGYEPD